MGVPGRNEALVAHTIHVQPQPGGRPSQRTVTAGAVTLAPVDQTGWLHHITVEIRDTRVTVVVAGTDPHAPINRLTVRPDGSATFTT